MNKQEKIITVDYTNFIIKDEFNNFKYQEELTKKLDTYSDNFNQEIINEIVLWKVNRYAKLPDEAFILLNKININETLLTEEQENIARELLSILLNPLSKGIQLPMASTILRFKNKNIFQIIDQRVYRVLYGENLSLKPYKSQQVTINEIEMYFKYLKDLKEKCNKLNIPFSDSDRILYLADKHYNKSISLNNYGNQTKNQ